MTDELEQRLLAGAAYRIFFDELNKHLEATRTVFVEAVGEETLREAGARFHTIRGGAGFFKLSKLSEIAGELEKILMNGSVSEIEAELPRLRELDSELRKQASSIPAPAPVSPPA